MTIYPDTIIKRGSLNAEAVKLIKQRLNELQYGNLDATNGNFGESTEEVVKSFQRKQQLKDDGEVGELTWERLFTVSIIQPVTSTDLVTRVMQWMDTQLFVREKTGHNDGREIEMYQKTVGIAKGSPYCQALVYTGFFLNSNVLNIKCPMPRTGSVLTHRDIVRNRPNGPGKIVPVSQARPGDIFIMDFGGGKGHTGMIEEVKTSTFWTVEGNTTADPKNKAEDREAGKTGGNYERVRKPSTIDCLIRY